jgi:hypothetical protein
MAGPTEHNVRGALWGEPACGSDCDVRIPRMFTDEKQCCNPLFVKSPAESTTTPDRVSSAPRPGPAFRALAEARSLILC